MVDERRIAVLGAGRIGEALIAGLLSSGWREPAEISASSRREERVAELVERYGVQATTSNVEAASGASLVVLSVKPQDIEALLGEIGTAISARADGADDRRGDADRDRRALSRRGRARRPRDAEHAVHRPRGNRRPVCGRPLPATRT